MIDLPAADGPVSILDMAGSVAGGVGSVASAIVAVVAVVVALKLYRRDRARDAQDTGRALAEAEAGRRRQADLVGVWLSFDMEPDEPAHRGQIWITNRSDAPIHDIMCIVGKGLDTSTYILPGLGPQSRGYFDAKDYGGGFCRQYMVGFRDRRGTRWHISDSGELTEFNDNLPSPSPEETRRLINALIARESASTA